MKKFALTFVLFLFMGAAQANQCLYLYQDVKDDCEFGFNDSCAKLEQCQERRTSCPQAVNDKKSCIEFNVCMETLHTKNSKIFKEKQAAGQEFPVIEKVLNDPLNGCRYTYDEKQKTCQNTNIYNTDPWDACPGKGSFLDKFSDKGGDCEGHKAKLKHLRTQCVISLSKYIKACGENINGKPIPDEMYSMQCDALEKTVIVKP